MVPYTSIPVLSALFLVLIGVLIGQLFWYRYRDRHEQTARQLQGKYRELKLALGQRTAESEQWAAQLGDASRELDQLRAALTTAGQSAERWEFDCRTIRDQLALEQKARIDLQNCLNDERQLREQLETASRQSNHQLNDETTRRQAEASARQSLQSEFNALLLKHTDLERTAEQLRHQANQWAEDRSVANSTADRHCLDLNDARQQLHAAHDREAALTQENRSLTDLLDSAQAKQAQLQTRITSLETNLHEQDELRRQACQRSEELQGELSRRASQEEVSSAQIRQLQQAVLAAQSDYQLVLSQLEDRQATGNRHERTASEALARLKEVQLQLATVQAEHRALQSAQQRSMEEAAAERATMQAELRDTQSQLDGSHQRHDELASRERQTAAAMERLAEQLAARQAEVIQVTRERDQHLDQLTGATHSLIGTKLLAADVRQLQSRLQQRELLVGRLEGELQQQTDTMSSLLSEVETLRDTVDDLQLERNQFESDLRAQRRCHDQLDQHLADERQQRAALQEALTNQRDKLTVARRELERLETLEDRSVEMEAEYRLAREELKQLKRHRDQALEAESTTREAIAGLRDELSDRLDEIAALRREKDTFQSQLELERRQRKQTQDALDGSDQHLAALRAELDTFSSRHARLTARTTELEDQLTDARNAARIFEEQLHTLHGEHSSLADQLQRERQATRQQKQSLVHRRVDSPGDVKGAFSFRDLHVRDRSLREADDAKLQRHPTLGNVYESPPIRRDDLKKIPGVTAAEERQLNELGIYTFRQVMEWTEPIIDEISRRLELGDGVRRHDWAGVARGLHHHERTAA